MASLRKKDRSPYYFACFTGPDGRRVQRSTKQAHRKQAQAVANEWEKAAHLASERRFGEAQARRVIADIYQAINRDSLRPWRERSWPIGRNNGKWTLPDEPTRRIRRSRAISWNRSGSAP